ncbi:hypothetical protein DIU31_003750 [Mucilaginibacter rubeus]|uniref:DUF4145 domain-containing protein n=1 Tax=Mucilaginibacter rubeus TaxID=2027860 RepID=A0AAE6MGX5_9SPHI|nr:MULTISPECIES: hypothetical protein [Mucilaginibacter]QEM02674.1 hypothetical protein DIU31_003750 [Mucilaginibacter rubeus]QEM15293.1 hypothetical protein DIU38_003785 [Mucilaginibacter gossypii]QTE41978.1 hypothetical protein J3L19_24010 [Mucilaginibacter rubeus]QTE48579.1 hypothetical protein J3L21_23990 [Mucilaginibacter rubeus]QTE59966.1 hypothetical protein J3L23_15625 [Mucilaginibacter rubeus]
MNYTFFSNQLDGIINEYSKIKSKAQYDDLSGGVDMEELISLIVKIKATVNRIVGQTSEYYIEASKIISRTNINDGPKLRMLIGIINALRDDINNGYLKTLNEIIQSEVFSNYLEMADYLLNEGYKDAAAVITGSTLEIHLKQLCTLAGIPIDIANPKGKIVPKKADVINAELTKSGKYNLAYQKQVTAWLDTRNSAAHGQYEDYGIGEIKLMIAGVRQFLLSYPA